MEQIVKVGEFPSELQRLIDQEFDCIDPETVLADDEIRSRVRAVVTRSNYRVSSELVEELPGLQVIATSGVSYDGIPLEVARLRNITVTNTPGVLDAAVCELGVGLLLAMLRQIPRADSYVRSGRWLGGAYPLTTSLSRMRVGIVGLGRIGKEFVRRLEPFGVAIGYGGGRQQNVPWFYAQNVTALAEWSDILVLCHPGGKETHHLIGATVIDALGEGWLVNFSRGSVVDEVALYLALQ